MRDSLDGRRVRGSARSIWFAAAWLIAIGCTASTRQTSDERTDEVEDAGDETPAEGNDSGASADSAPKPKDAGKSDSGQASDASKTDSSVDSGGSSDSGASKDAGGSSLGCSQLTCDPILNTGCAAGETCTAVGATAMCVAQATVQGGLGGCDQSKGKYCVSGYTCVVGVCYPMCDWPATATSKRVANHPDCKGKSGFGTTCSAQNECYGICTTTFSP